MVQHCLDTIDTVFLTVTKKKIFDRGKELGLGLHRRQGKCLRHREMELLQNQGQAINKAAAYDAQMKKHA
jgi:hypothetical protein